MGWMMLAGLVLAAGLAPAQTPGELLKNPGFEELDEEGWATGWERWPAVNPEPGAISLDANMPARGSHSVRLHHERSSSYTRVQQVIPVEAGRRYYFRVWMKAEGVTRAQDGGGMGCRMYIEGIGGRDYATQSDTHGTYGWKQMTIGPFEAKAGDQVTFMCYLHRSTGTVWYDDAQVIEATPDFERRQMQEHQERRLRRDLELARAAAEAAQDQVALSELRAFSESINVDDLPDRVDYRAGPAYFARHGELFGIMARLNARRFPGTPVSAWVSDPFEALPVLGLVPEPTAAQVRVVMGKGERDQGVINLCNLGEAPLRMRVSVTGFDGPGAPRVTVRETVHVEDSVGSLLADALPKLGEDGLSLPPGVFRQLWLDVSSAGCETGMYRGSVGLEGAQTPALTVGLEVEVLEVALPDPLPIATWNYSYTHEPLIKDRWEQARADLVAHHINAYCWPSWNFPWPEFDEAGKLLPLDWTSFEKAVATHDNTEFLLLWPQFEMGRNLALRGDLEVGSQLWEERFVAWFRALIAGLEERGFGHDRVIWYPTDEPTTSVRVNQQIAAARAIHKADPRALVLANPYSACTRSLLEDMGEVTDVWCAELNWASDGLLPYLRATSRHLWTYQVLGFGAPAFERYRLSFWKCFREGITGQGFWAYADCGASNWDRNDAPRNDYAVIYDGDPEELIPSKRWEAWREGVEDYSALWMLKQARNDEGARLNESLDRLLAEPSPDALAALRESVLRELAKRAPGPGQ